MCSVRDKNQYGKDIYKVLSLLLSMAFGVTSPIFKACAEYWSKATVAAIVIKRTIIRDKEKITERGMKLFFYLKER